MLPSWFCPPSTPFVSFDSSSQCLGHFFLTFLPLPTSSAFFLACIAPNYDKNVSVFYKRRTGSCGRSTRIPSRAPCGSPTSSGTGPSAALACTSPATLPSSPRRSSSTWPGSAGELRFFRACLVARLLGLQFRCCGGGGGFDALFPHPPCLSRCSSLNTLFRLSLSPRAPGLRTVLAGITVSSYKNERARPNRRPPSNSPNPYSYPSVSLKKKPRRPPTKQNAAGFVW